MAAKVNSKRVIYSENAAMRVSARDLRGRLIKVACLGNRCLSCSARRSCFLYESLDGDLIFGVEVKSK
jgi:hypothetical protein